MIKEQYSNTVSCVRVDGATRDCFLIKSGVRHRCILAPDCFDDAMDWLLNTPNMYSKTLRPEAFTNFHYADDIALLSELPSMLLSGLEMFAEEEAPIELTVNWKKLKNPAPQWLLASGTRSHSLWRAGRNCNDLHLSRRLDQHIVSQPP